MEPTKRALAAFSEIQRLVANRTVGSRTYPFSGATITNEAFTAEQWGRHGFTVVLSTGEVIEVEMRQVK